jgi:hypothetical protein
MSTYNIAIQRLDMPARFRRLPIDDRGFPIPKFVATLDGKPDFRVIAPGWWETCYKRKLCWLCGEQLGRHKAFVIGPMCAITRVTSEPPSHRECAEFAVKSCPFLTQPHRKRDISNLPEEGYVSGVHLDRNPGASVIWITDDYKAFNANPGVLIKLGDPKELSWWSHGRAASREEIMGSINGGLPLLREIARKDGADAEADLDKMITRGLALVPAA